MTQSLLEWQTLDFHEEKTEVRKQKYDAVEKADSGSLHMTEFCHASAKPVVN